MSSKKHFLKQTNRFGFNIAGLFSCLSFFILLSCAQGKKPSPQSEFSLSQDQLLAEFEKANKLLDAGQNEQAAKAYDKIMFDQPTTQLDILIIYNSGIAYYRNQNCEVAVQKFRKVIRLAEGASAIKARAMQQLSDAYTCLGEDNKAITNLIELYNGKFKLDSDIYYAELPVKLAAAYARVGNNKEAEHYYKIAERGLIKLQAFYAGKKDKNIIMARTLYTMGTTAQLNPHTMSSEDFFRSAQALQKYLYKAAEYGVAPWSYRATEELNDIYEKAWVYVESAQVPSGEDAALTDRALRQEKSKIVKDALNAVTDLIHQRIPSPDEPESLKSFIKRVHQHELKFKNFLATNQVGVELTPEAKEVQSLKRSGRVANPNPVLEQKALKKKKKNVEK